MVKKNKDKSTEEEETGTAGGSAGVGTSYVDWLDADNKSIAALANRGDAGAHGFEVTHTGMVESDFEHDPELARKVKEMEEQERRNEKRYRNGADRTNPFKSRPS